MGGPLEVPPNQDREVRVTQTVDRHLAGPIALAPLRSATRSRRLN